MCTRACGPQREIPRTLVGWRDPTAGYCDHARTGCMCSGDDPGSFSSLMLSVRARTRACAHACMHACVAYAAMRVTSP
jgi:hypothetical protein